MVNTLKGGSWEYCAMLYHTNATKNQQHGEYSHWETSKWERGTEPGDSLFLIHFLLRIKTVGKP